VVDGASATPEVEVRDLAGGVLPAADEQLQSKILSYHDQRKTQRKVLFYAALGFSGLMTLAFLCFVFRLLGVAESNGGTMPDWHLLLLGSGLILPPTIILFGLMRRVYGTEDNSKSGAEQQPVGPGAELLATVGELLQKVVGMLASVADASSKKG